MKRDVFMKKLKKIDIHVHSTPETGFVNRFTGDTYATPEQLRKIYDAYGIEKGVLLPSGIYGDCSCDLISMREARDMVRKHHETLGWWFCGIHPNMGLNRPDTDLSYFINQLKAHGARGIGEVTINMYFDDPFMLNLFHHAEKCSMPVTFHIGDMGGDYGLVDELGLPRLEKVLNMFPNLKFLGHSQKFWAEIGTDCNEENRKGYPEGPVVPGRVVELMRKYDNLYGDLSAGSGFNAVSRDPEFGYKFFEEFQDKLFFGTDICSPRNISNPMLKLSGFLDEAMENGKISYSAYEKISRGNALKLLS